MPLKPRSDVVSPAPVPSGQALNGGYTVDAVARALDVLEAFQNADSLTLGEVARRVALNKSRVFRMLHTLVQRGYVERSADGTRYELGIRLLERAASVRRPLRQIALPFMRVLQEEFNETVNLAVLEKHEVVYVEMLESSHPVRMAEGIGYRSPIHSTALGKVMAAHLPDADRVKLLRSITFHRLTDRTITTQTKLQAEFDHVRRRGYAVDDRENDPECFCIGAPVFDRDGRPVAAMSVSGPTERVSRKRDQIAHLLKQVCRQISDRIALGELIPGASPTRIK